MNLHGFLTNLLTNLVFVPAIILCFAPMTDQLKWSIKKTLAAAGVISITLISAVSLLEAYLSVSYYYLILPVFLIVFVLYSRSLTVPVHKSLFIMLVVFTFYGFISNFSTGFDAILHPTGSISRFSMEAAGFQLLLATISCGLLFVPLNRFGRRLINDFDIPRIYILSIPIWGIFLGFNLLITPRKYETIHVNRMPYAYWGSLVLILILFLLLCLLFFFIVSDMMRTADAREKARILEMQESYFLAQQRYMNETARVRHDFKHTIGALSMMINDGDYSAAKYYINEFLKDQPQNETVNYCSNLAVNALLNYYGNMGKNNHIRIEMEIALPDSLPVSDTDMCSILGNILENAILACDNLPDKDRFIDMAIRRENESMLYIVATNSFDGKANKNGDTYLSTRRSGSGLGLKSIKETAEKYGGSVRFSHKGTEFYTDVVLPTSQ